MSHLSSDEINEMKNIVQGAAKFMTKFEQHDPTLINPDAALYMQCAAVIDEISEQKMMLGHIRFLSQQHPALAEMLESKLIDGRITRNRKMNCPELDQLIERLTQKA